MTMTNHHKQFYKRFFCLLLMLAAAVVYIPDVTPKAQAAPGGVGVLPIPAPNVMPFFPGVDAMGSDVFMQQFPPCTVDTCNPEYHVMFAGQDIPNTIRCSFGRYIALNETMMAALRSAGIQYVETSPTTGVYMPNEKLTEPVARHMMETTAAIYNSLDYVAQSEIWEQAKKLPGAWASGAQAIVQFGSDLIARVQGKHKELYPPTLVTHVGDISVSTIQGMCVRDIIRQYGTFFPAQTGSLTRENIYIRIDYPLTWYNDNGFKTTYLTGLEAAGLVTLEQQELLYETDLYSYQSSRNTNTRIKRSR